MADAIFTDPALARIYDAFDGERDDLDVYLDLVRELGAREVLDLGCGTGSLPILLTGSGIRVTGVDPAATSLEVARGKEAADQVRWIQADATTLPPLQVDLAIMTGNVAQVFLTDDEWLATLTGLAGALKPHGRLVFETRRPSCLPPTQRCGSAAAMRSSRAWPSPDSPCWTSGTRQTVRDAKMSSSRRHSPSNARASTMAISRQRLPV